MKTVAASNDKLPALRPVKSIKKSKATLDVLSVAPVDKSTIFPVPFWTPPVLPVTNDVEAVVVFVGSGMVAVPLGKTLPNRLAPVPLAKPLVQFAMSEKFSA
ncbi:hypothetical protein [Nibrella viscosa]|uniref:hypothetical protein n=1 Tax=Nibrella viscosa TaxID=1084524 RepID=UPI0031E9AF96